MNEQTRPNQQTRPNRTPRAARPDQKLLTIAQVVIETGVANTSVRELINTGAVPFVRLGDSRRIYIRRSDLDQLIERGTERRAS